MKSLEFNASRHLKQGLTLLFWASLLELLLPNAIAFFNPFLHAFSKNWGFFQEWFRYIYPILGTAAFAGVILITINSPETPKLIYFKKLLPSFAAIALLARFLPRFIPKEVTYTRYFNSLLEAVTTAMVAWYLKELCAEAKNTTLANSWLQFLKLYIITIVITSILLSRIDELPHDINQSYLYVGAMILRIPVWIYGLRLLLKTRKALSGCPKTNGEQSA